MTAMASPVVISLPQLFHSPKFSSYDYRSRRASPISAHRSVAELSHSCHRVEVLNFRGRDCRLLKVGEFNYSPCSAERSYGRCCSASARLILARGRRFGGERSRRAEFSQSWALNAARWETQVAGEPNIPCDNCNGRGWLVCEFCEGQKVNVQSKSNRLYRRCPTCRACFTSPSLSYHSKACLKVCFWLACVATNRQGS